MTLGQVEITKIALLEDATKRTIPTILYTGETDNMRSCKNWKRRKCNDLE